MAETRQSLTEKVNALEDSVLGTMQTATTAVQDTVDSVRSAVEGTVETVRRQFQSAFDVRRHVRQRPWIMVAGASVAGFLTGIVFQSRRRPATAPAPTVRPSVGLSADSPRRIGLWDTLAGRVEEELKKAGESAIQCLSARLHRVMQDGLSDVEHQTGTTEEKPANELSVAYPIGRWNGAVHGTRM
jgi:ElaB/YqjD/DUF883 family membrane-anchored ribosome-binding protein